MKKGSILQKWKYWFFANFIVGFFYSISFVASHPDRAHLVVSLTLGLLLGILFAWFIYHRAYRNRGTILLAIMIAFQFLTPVSYAILFSRYLLGLVEMATGSMAAIWTIAQVVSWIYWVRCIQLFRANRLFRKNDLVDIS